MLSAASATVRLGPLRLGTERQLATGRGPRLERALDVARRDRLQGKDLASALGFKPHYLVAAVTTPREGHCYKTVRALSRS